MQDRATMNDEEMISCQDPSKQIDRLRSIMQRLRGEGGCPWDAEQTHESLIPDLIEESYEVIDAIRATDMNHLREELGDLLLQVIFHAEITREKGLFDLDAIACELNDKLVRRHPHVFATSRVSDTEGVLTQWDQIKREERGTEEKPYLHGIGKGLPSLLRAGKLQKKAAKTGFDWPDLSGVIDKIKEELAEVEETLPLQDTDPHVEEELGDLLFSVVNLCRKRGVDPEVALASTNQKFESRFSQVEALLKAKGISLGQANLDEMEACWQLAKRSVPEKR